MCRQALAEPIEFYHPIEIYFQQVEDTNQFSQDSKTSFSPAHIVQAEYHAVNKTGLYSLALKEWQKKVTTNHMWKTFRQAFAEEYQNLVEETKVASGYAGFHSANEIQEIGGALDHLDMATVDNKDVLT